MEVWTHPSYKERKESKRWSKSIEKEKGKRKSKVILRVLSILGEQVRDNSGSCSYCRPKQHKRLCPTLGASPTARCIQYYEQTEPEDNLTIK